MEFLHGAVEAAFFFILVGGGALEFQNFGLALWRLI